MIMPDVIGVTFPIPKLYIPRFFDGGKTIFIKPASIFKELQPGMKFVFYQSQEDTGYIGEALIKKITISEDPFSFFDIYGDNIFLTREELKKYIEKNKKWIGIHTKRKIVPKRKKWLAIELESIQKYNDLKKPKQFVPIGGKYINSDPDN
jgi:hypothetical protein